MQAGAAPFTFLRSQSEYIVPYFQRSYVWGETNWKELLENLLDTNRSHFLGSIILKSVPFTSGTLSKWSVIDGQQRLTTLSILFRAAYDTLPMDDYDDEIKKSIDAERDNLLFNRGIKIKDPKTIKISHSRLDAEPFRQVIAGDAKGMVDSIRMEYECDKGQKPSSKILQCYKYFYKELDGKNDDSETIFEFLKNDDNAILVKIDLDSNENEQAIFDTVNTAGVRLTCSDTIKNALFQRLKDFAKTDSEQNEVILTYKKYWEAVFASDEDAIEFWSTEKKRGRFKTDNLEILLQSVALIYKIFNHYDHNVSELTDLYRYYIQQLSEKDTNTFIEDIAEYAKLYREYFVDLDPKAFYSCDDPLGRLLHILNALDISTMHPYILKLLKDFKVAELDAYPTEFLTELKKVETYVIRLAACNESLSNLNKVCTLLMNGRTMDEELVGVKDKISDDKLKAKMRIKKDNRIAAVILYWLELYSRHDDGKATQQLAYAYTLEHIMPQKWEANWSITDIPVKDVDTQKKITDKEQATETREAAVYEIGNMLLLNGKLNTSLRNYDIVRKIDGEKTKKGIRYYNELMLTKDFLGLYDKQKKWNELLIRQRTDELTQKFIKYWPVN